MFSAIYNPLIGQTIKGKVLDKETNNAIGFAQIYFNGTSVGTFTDVNGNFVLNITKYSYMPLAISALGYETIVLKNFKKDSLLIINLSQKTFDIEKVDISADLSRKNREANIKIFKREFLGESSNAEKTKILNEDDVSFVRSENEDTLWAYSLKPIQIENRALGYKISYYLDQFEFCLFNHSFILSGNFIFTEDSVSNKSQSKRFQKARQLTFLGSRMHFFRALWNEDLGSKGFKIDFPRHLLVDKLEIFQDEATAGGTMELSKYIHFLGPLPTRITIDYKPKNMSSDITLTEAYILIEKNGFFEGGKIFWYGDMAMQRIADLLPYEYIER